jgi:hypothetical protein
MLMLLLLLVTKANSLLGHFGFDESMRRFSLIKFLLGLPQQSDKNQIRQLVRLNTVREKRTSKFFRLIIQVLRNVFFCIGIIIIIINSLLL